MKYYFWKDPETGKAVFTSLRSMGYQKRFCEYMKELGIDIEESSKAPRSTINKCMFCSRNFEGSGCAEDPDNPLFYDPEFSFYDPKNTLIQSVDGIYCSGFKPRGWPKSRLTKKEICGTLQGMNYPVETIDRIKKIPMEDLKPLLIVDRGIGVSGPKENRWLHHYKLFTLDFGIIDSWAETDLDRKNEQENQS